MLLFFAEIELTEKIKEEMINQINGDKNNNKLNNKALELKKIQRKIGDEKKDGGNSIYIE